MKAKIVLASGSLLLAACGGRASEAVTVERTTDSLLSCDHMTAEHRVNSKRIPELDKERSSESSNNAGLLLVAPLFMDFSDTEKKEIEALKSRNIHLVGLMDQKKCTVIPSGDNETDQSPNTQATETSDQSSGD